MKNTHSFNNCFFPNSWFGSFTQLQQIWIDPLNSVKLCAFPSSYNLIPSNRKYHRLFSSGVFSSCFSTFLYLCLFLPIWWTTRNFFIKNTSKKVNKFFHTLNKPAALRFYFCYPSERLSALAGILSIVIHKKPPDVPKL